MTLVKLRGGLDGINTNRHIKRVVAWADILHATAHDEKPQFGIAQYGAHREMERLLELVRKHTHSMVFEDNCVPIYFQDVLSDLQALAMAKSLLSKKTFGSLQELRSVFSNLLFVAEHRILELGDTASSSKSMIVTSSAIETVKAAALIFTIHGLRDLAITAAFYDSLVRRLRNGLYDIVHNGGHHLVPTSISDRPISATFLLWLCLIGWKASATKSRQTERKFFRERAATLCKSLKIDSLTELYSHISKIMLLSDYQQPGCSGLWRDINSWATSSDIDWMASQQRIPFDDCAAPTFAQL